MDMSPVRASAGALARLVRRLGRKVCGDDSPRISAADGLVVEEREQFIRRILSTIHNNSILLCGGPGTGKTSLLLHLKERLSASGDPATKFFPVYIDLHDVPERLLFATVANAVTQQLAPMPILSHADWSPASGSVYGHRDLAKDFRSVLRTLKDRSTGQARLVLLIDDIDELNNYAPRTAQRVRSLFMASFDGSLVMVASAVKIDKHWEQEGSPWYNFFEEIELPPVDRVKRRPG
jgi:Cdc6-like AAA superfamily ATPase